MKDKTWFYYRLINGRWYPRLHVYDENPSFPKEDRDFISPIIELQGDEPTWPFSALKYKYPEPQVAQNRRPHQ